ncbi:MAG: Sec-independent protein translocase protein TatB [Burkholderiales bacterium]
MFDLSFGELAMIGAVALIVLGPERLPKVARTLGHLFGRMQRYVNDVKADISREMELEELKRLQTTIQDAASSFEQSVTREVNAAQTDLQKIAQDASPGAAEAAASPALPPEPGAPAAQLDAAPAQLAQAEAGAQLDLDLSAPKAPAGKTV